MPGWPRRSEIGEENHLLRDFNVQEHGQYRRLCCRTCGLTRYLPRDPARRTKDALDILATRHYTPREEHVTPNRINAAAGCRKSMTTRFHGDSKRRHDICLSDKCRVCRLCRSDKDDSRHLSLLSPPTNLHSSRSTLATSAATSSSGRNRASSDLDQWPESRGNRVANLGQLVDFVALRHHHVTSCCSASDPRRRRRG
jgi:hypothetical protein